MFKLPIADTNIGYCFNKARWTDPVVTNDSTSPKRWLGSATWEKNCTILLHDFPALLYTDEWYTDPFIFFLQNYIP